MSECDREASIMKRPWPSRGRCTTEKMIHMKAVRFSRMSVNLYQNSRCHIPEHDQLHTYGRECLNSLMLIDMSTFDYCIRISDVSIINRSDSRPGLLYPWYPPQLDRPKLHGMCKMRARIEPRSQVRSELVQRKRTTQKMKTTRNSFALMKRASNACVISHDSP